MTFATRFPYPSQDSLSSRVTSFLNPQQQVTDSPQQQQAVGVSLSRASRVLNNTSLINPLFCFLLFYRDMNVSCSAYANHPWAIG